MTKLYTLHGIHADAKIARPVKLPDDTIVTADVETLIVEIVPSDPLDQSGSQNLKFVGEARQALVDEFLIDGLLVYDNNRKLVQAENLSDNPNSLWDLSFGKHSS